MEVLLDIQPEPLAERIAVRVHLGGRHLGRATGAGVSVASRTSLPLRRDGHTKVYCRRSEKGCATARTCNGRTYQNRGLCHAAEALLGPALCSDEHRIWQVYHAQSRFSLRW